MMMAVMVAVGHHHTMRMMTVSGLIGICMLHRRTVAPEMRGLAFHGDGRERLNRKAQYQQHDDEKFAPIRHGCEV
ncbi:MULTISPECIES: hypothetical protein [Paraburkholderia]|jgi:hypothetical protein|uniref:Secreted protein n=1 Tax=Paraburkholderia fungorum TaxID=134537 RepID=A0AAW3V0T1_9BURK|nr:MULTISPECIES: hypothetical protein [Paraburkholderia]MBB4515529.1 hypothetical protein [Paraburkholderia fungorum]MBB6203472.1 hypothetical protein [Paraburkholderia fungorum]